MISFPKVADHEVTCVSQTWRVCLCKRGSRAGNIRGHLCTPHSWCSHCVQQKAHSDSFLLLQGYECDDSCASLYVDVNAAEMPGREVLETARCWTPTPRPIPNLGYACLNMELREQRPPIFTNRSTPPPTCNKGHKQALLCLAVVPGCCGHIGACFGTVHGCQ